MTRPGTTCRGSLNLSHPLASLTRHTQTNADSRNILIFYWHHPAQYWDYLEHARWVTIQIMKLFNVEGIDFAFPTQTLHLAGDDKRPLTVGQRQISEEAFSKN